MINGTVSAAGDPTVMLPVAGQLWRAIVDTGFNGDLELPEALRAHVQPLYMGQTTFILAGGLSITEESFEVQFPFDSNIVTAEATFVPSSGILIGTRLMKNYHLEIDFPAQTVELQRVP